jgi:hypothetical protein
MLVAFSSYDCLLAVGTDTHEGYRCIAEFGEAREIGFGVGGKLVVVAAGCGIDFPAGQLFVNWHGTIPGIAISGW